MAKGFAYLVAILDLYSRKVLSFRVSNAMSTDFCVEALEEALTRYGAPEIRFDYRGIAAKLTHSPSSERATFRHNNHGVAKLLNYQEVVFD